MISNLKAYNNHKLSTLQRLEQKYSGYLIDVLESHLKQNTKKIADALIAGKKNISISVESLRNKLIDVLEEHRAYTVLVGISDAMREESPRQKGSVRLAWSETKMSFPIELSFTELAEVKKRDLIARMVNKRISKKARSIIEKIVDEKIESYLKTIEKIYKKSAFDYINDEESTDTVKSVREIIKQITGVSKSSADRIFRTETTRYFSQARIDYFKDYSDTDFVQLMAVTDGRTSEICECRDLYVIPIAFANLKKNKPPFHPHCRTIPSPLDTDLKSDEDEVRKHLGAEFGTVVSKVSGKKFTGKRPKPNIPLPKGWA